MVSSKKMTSVLPAGKVSAATALAVSFIVGDPYERERKISGSYREAGGRFPVAFAGTITERKIASTAPESKGLSLPGMNWPAGGSNTTKARNKTTAGGHRHAGAGRETET